MYRNVLLLALCQALLMTGTSLLIASSALVGRMLTPLPALATLPLALQFLTTMLTAFPAALLMKRVGRRVGFMSGAVLGIAGAALCTAAILGGSFALFCLGAMLMGAFSGFGQFYRFAAVDVVAAEFRSRAISWVLAGGVLAAFLGPNLAAWARQWLAVPFAGSYAAVTAVTVLSLLTSGRLRIPAPGAEEAGGVARPLVAIAAQPTFAVALLAGMVSYGAMNLVMTATPLAMADCGLPFDDTAFVIQWHVVAMFLPSFFTGHLIRRFGVLTVMAVGALLLAACVAVNFSGLTRMHFSVALMLLGMGWNFLYIGATTLLTETYAPAEKAKTQALNDCLVFGSVTLTALSAGALQQRFGWLAVNAGVLPAIALVLAAVLWLGWRRRLSPAAA
ncbi:MAG TPA: MFS transporter, partial [Candidatus Competibacteraceae bacterium]|nr:MFS transporter [Candidatus Competibacteraceae bacterium]